MSRFLLFVLIITALGQNTFAQSFIISGRVVDKDNRPVKKALVQAVGTEDMGFATTNDDGLYFTAAVPAGKYEVIVKVDTIPYITKMDIAPTDPQKRFYNFRLKDKKAELTKTDKDVFMESAFNKLRSGSDNFPEPKRQGTIRIKKR